jgi:hypothetical protein
LSVPAEIGKNDRSSAESGVVLVELAINVHSLRRLLNFYAGNELLSANIVREQELQSVFCQEYKSILIRHAYNKSWATQFPAREWSMSNWEVGAFTPVLYPG